jgi:CheY-like chemotaxis protein
LRQILLNIVGNAIKFTEYGSVRLVVASEGEAGSSRICFEIIDTGIGMTPEQRGALFIPFSQADTSTSRKFGGSGLGLAICKRLADMLGGTLSAQSELGKGTTFRFSMNVGATDAPPMLAERLNVSAEPADSENAAHQMAGHILLVEDAQDTQALARALLEARGFTVDTAENGRIAVNRVLAASRDGRPYDLVLLDMQMPSLDGYSAARELRKLGFASLPLIAFTAHASKQEQQKCEAAGCNGYLTKPIDQNLMFSTIAAHLNGGSKGAPPAPAPTQTARTQTPAMQALVPGFIARIPAIIEEIQSNLDRGAFDPILERMHKLAGSGGTYGFPEISRLASEAENTLLRERNVDGVTRTVGQLLEYLRQVKREQCASGN